MSTVLSDHRNYRACSDAEHLSALADEPDTTACSVDDPLEDLVSTVAGVLNIRTVFSRISEISSRVLPHDGMELVVHDQFDRVTLHVQSTDDIPRSRHTTVAGPDAFWIVRDCRDLQFFQQEQRAWVQEALASGYRSCLSVRSRAGAHRAQLAFFSKRAGNYTLDHVPSARHLTSLLALAVSHEQLASAAQQRIDVPLRTPNIDSRVRSVARDGASDAPHVVGESFAWRRALQRATQVAATETTVFLQGESGTGKEVLARFIHRASPRRNGPFVAINCAALPEQLLESELFGYERGAFTGAQQAKPGQIEVASRGVLFLDEVSEMNPTAQAKLLRFLQEREFQRLGGTRIVKADVRVIAASNRNLRDAVADGTFREDLYYRLQVFDIPIPPLRERPDDIPLLVGSFLATLGRSMGSQFQLTPASMQKLVGHHWPGNVRELHNALERAAILAGENPIEPDHFSLHTAASGAHPGSDLRAIESQKIREVLQETDGNKAKAARRLGITRTQLYVRLRKYAVDDAPPFHFSSTS